MEYSSTFNFLKPYVCSNYPDFDAELLQTIYPQELIKNHWNSTKVHVSQKTEKGLKSVEFLLKLLHIPTLSSDEQESLLKLKNYAFNYIVHKCTKNKLGDQALSLFQGLMQAQIISTPMEEQSEHDVLDEFFGQNIEIPNLQQMSLKRVLTSENPLKDLIETRKKMKPEDMPLDDDQMRGIKEKMMMYINQRCHCEDPLPLESTPYEEIQFMFGLNKMGTISNIEEDKKFISSCIQKVIYLLVDDLLKLEFSVALPKNYDDALCFLLFLETNCK